MATDFTGQLDFVGALRTVTAFCQLREPVLHDLAAEMVTVSLSDGETVTRQNDGGAKLRIVISGALGVTCVDHLGIERTLPDVQPGGTVGEISLLADLPSATAVRACGAVLLAELSRAGFERFAERWPAPALELIEALRPQLLRRRLQLALRESRTFRELDPAVLADLESEFDPVALYGGEALFRAGDVGDSLYIVVSGRLRVVARAPGGTERVVAELGPGETVGEMAIITGERRSADVYAGRDTQLARLSKAAVERVLERYPRATLLILAGGLVNRVRDMSSGTRRGTAIATVAIVPAAPGVPLGPFGERLSAALSRLGTTLYLTSDRVDAALERRGAAQAYDREGGATRLLEWLAVQEREHRFVLYQSDSDCSPWTERVLRQADHVVIVADSSGDAAPGEIETELLSREQASRTRRTLALLYRNGATPRDTLRWLTGRTLDRHLHLRFDEPDDFGRLARMLTGNAVGLVLGGGFARGLAHLGVLRALRELDIHIDAIGGSSMGAMVAAQWALGWDASRIVHETCTSFASSFDDMTMPFLAFKRGGKHTRFLKGFFGDTQIEDLWVPYFCASANLNRAELKIHTRGSLATAVLASTRAPGVFPPVVIDGELHVDGGLINNTPVDVMRTFSNEGIVVGVDVSPPHELNLVADYGGDVSGWRAVWHRFNPTKGKRIYRPSILLVLMRVIEFGGISSGRDKAAFADLYIEPDLLRFKRNDFHAAADMAEVGYRAARKALDDWLATGSAAYGTRRPDLFSQRSPAVARG
jgi:predicted acylesterase/phospholipase RssA/CRP-like cAMP-binding protein